MKDWATTQLNLASAETAPRFVRIQKSPDVLDDNLWLRRALLDFIGDFAIGVMQRVMNTLMRLER